MKNLLLILLLFGFAGIDAQETIIYDFESADSPGTYTHFGSSLEGTDAPVIDNPNATGINESAKVMELTRPAASQTFAGAFANPNLPFAIGVAPGGKICVDAHFSHNGTFTVKLEGSGAGDWERTIANTTLNEWETLCYDLDSISTGATPESAVGKEFPKMAIFQDLNAPAGEADITIYLDNFRYVGELLDVQKTDVTFSVDVSNITVGENGMFIAGDAINGWTGDATPMSNDDGDETWEITLALAPGTSQFKFVNSGEFEDLEAGLPCTVPAGDFTNRGLEVGEEALVLPTYFFGSCDSPAAEDIVTTIFDWETPETSTNFLYFGGSIDNDTADVVDNPNPTDINNSPNVIRYIKPAGSMTWAGAYADPKPAAIDVTNGGMICVDVHFAHTGNIGIKLEESETVSNWIDTVEVTEINTWQTVCVDVAQNGLEDDMVPAAGHVFGQMVIFPDFGTVFEENDTSFIDNIRLITPAAGAMNDVTFAVNMNEYTGEFTTVFLSGEFNEWSGGANPMADEDGDGIWSTTIPLENGAYEYKFQVDMWTDSEQFDGSDVCTRTVVADNGDVFVNRLATITEAATLGPVCWASCYDCGASVNITWNVNMENEDVSEQGVYLAGGPFFGHAELPAMTDEDGDGVYTITLNRELGFTTDYVFLNGICLPNWECKEQLAGQDCAVDPFNDRNLPAVSQDTIVSTCFGECSDDGSCTPPAETFMATFSVDMTNEMVSGDSVYLTGEFVNWQNFQIPMTDEDGDGVYTATTMLAEGVTQYKFVNGGEYEAFAEEGECNITTADGQFINRLLLMEAKDTVVQTYFFNSCQLSTSVKDLVYSDDLFVVKPTVTYDIVTLTWKNNESRNISIVNASGMLVETISTSEYENERSITVNDYAPGLYFVKMDTESTFGIEKFIVK